MDNKEERNNMSLGLLSYLAPSLRRDTAPPTSPLSSKNVPLVSPMTSLAMEFSNSSMRTPRRRLSMSSIESNTPRSPLDADGRGRLSSLSSDQGYQTESSSEPPTPLSPLESGLLGVGFLACDVETPKRVVHQKSSSLAVFNTSPEDQKENVSPSDQSTHKDDFVFARPAGIRLQRKAYSLTSRPSPQPTPLPNSRVCIRTSPPSPMGDFMNAAGSEVKCGDSSSVLQSEKLPGHSLPSGFADLIEKPIIGHAGDSKESSCGLFSKRPSSTNGARMAHRHLLRCPSESALSDRCLQSPCSWKSPAVKRSIPWSSSPSSAAAIKKMRAYSLSEEANHSSHMKSILSANEVSPMRRSHSMSFTSPFIDKAFGIGCEDAILIGDFSKQPALPVCNRNEGLMNITCQTLSDLLTGTYNCEIGHHIIVDCRYPFEYTGGHIKGAENLYLKDQVIDFFLKDPVKPPQDGRRLVIVFHCEFSSQRGPTMCKFLRSRDRQFHYDNGDYPTLYYPEMYLLSGGYKAFYAEHKELCEPNGYTPMNADRHSQDLTRFIKKAKSWSGESCGKKPGLR